MPRIFQYPTTHVILKRSLPEPIPIMNVVRLGPCKNLPSSKSKLSAALDADLVGDRLFGEEFLKSLGVRSLGVGTVVVWLKGGFDLCDCSSRAYLVGTSQHPGAPHVCVAFFFHVR